MDTCEHGMMASVCWRCLTRERDEARESARKAAHDWQETVRDQSGRLAKAEQRVKAAERERDEAYTKGAQWMLGAIRSTLRNYPNEGGDVEVMKEVERIVRQRVAALEEAARELRIDANRLCDRNLGGTYEADCRRSIAKVDAALAQKDEPR